MNTPSAPRWQAWALLAAGVAVAIAAVGAFLAMRAADDAPPNTVGSQTGPEDNLLHQFQGGTCPVHLARQVQADLRPA